MHNEEVHNLHASLNIIRVSKLRRVRWAVHVSRIRDMWNACNILIGKPEGKRPRWKPGCRWEDNIRMCVRKYRGNM